MAQTWVDKLNSILEKKVDEPSLSNEDCLLDVGDKHDNFVFQLLYPQTMWEQWYVTTNKLLFIFNKLDHFCTLGFEGISDICLLMFVKSNFL